MANYDIELNVTPGTQAEVEMAVEVGSGVSESNAEAWAVGKRRGVDVPSTDPTYHNNSKYYAQQADEDAQTASGAKDAAVDAKGDAEAARDAAQSAVAHYPYVDPTTGNWMCWDTTTGTWVNTGVRILKENRKSSGKSARGQAKQNFLFEANGEHLLYEVFDECGYLHGILRMTEQSLRIAFDNEIESLHSEFTMTAQSLRIAFTNEIASTRSEFRMTAESLRISFENEAASLRSGLEMEAGRIGLVVEGYGTSASIKLSAITDGINNDSTLELNADRIWTGKRRGFRIRKRYLCHAAEREVRHHHADRGGSPPARSGTAGSRAGVPDRRQVQPDRRAAHGSGELLGRLPERHHRGAVRRGIRRLPGRFRG